jgi:hypothetical protein
MSNQEVVVELDFGLPKELSPNGRAHWRTKYKLSQALKDSVYYRARDYNVIDPAVVKYHHRWCGRSPDEDNFIASMKPALDGLVKAGVLVDDGPSHLKGIEVSYERVPHRSQRSITITVEPMGTK